MPRVPTYDNFTVSPTTLPNAQVATLRISDVGAKQLEQTGQAITQVGRAAATIATDIQNDVNRSRVDDAATQAEQLRNQKTLEFAKLQGKDALSQDIYKQYTDDYAKSLGELRNSLSNDAQRFAFDRYSRSYQTDLSSKLNAHIFEQQKLYDQQVQLGKQAVSAETMALNWNNPAAIEEGRNATINSVRAQFPNAPDDFIVAKTTEALTAAHAGVVGTALQQKNYTYAKEYLDRFGSEINTETRNRLSQAAKVGETQTAAQEFADDAMSRGLNLTSALSEARAKFSGDMEEQAVSQIKVRFNEVETAKTLDVKNTVDTAWKEVMSTGKLSPTMAVTLRDVAPKEEKEILNYLDAKATKRLKDAAGSFKGDRIMYIRARTMAMNDPVNYVKTFDVEKAEPYLTNEQLNHLQTLKENLSKGNAKALQMQSLMKQTMDSIQTSLVSAGFNLNPKPDTPQAKQLEDFKLVLMNELDNEIDMRDKANKPPPTFRELHDVGMRLLAPGIVQGSGFFDMFQTTARSYQFRSQPEFEGKTFILKNYADIPPDIRTKLIAEFKPEGPRGQLSDNQKAEVERMYARGVQAGRFK